MYQKHLLLAAAALLPAVSCSLILEDRIQCSFQVPVTVRVDDFAITMDEFPSKSARDAADCSDVKSLTLAFYSGGAEAYKATQTRGALPEGESFGEFSLSLPMGAYTMVVIGHGLKDDEQAVTLTGPTSASFGDCPARETFACTQSVNIPDAEAVNLSATLSRIVAKLQVASSDVRTPGACSVRMTFASGGKSFSPSSGLATVDTGFSNTVDISTAAGVESLSNSYLFLNTDEQTMDVTLETLDEGGNVIFHKTVENVPFKRNRVTILTGKMYTNDSVSGAFQLETGWLDNYNGTF